jgi:hypothetical protein
MRRSPAETWMLAEPEIGAAFQRLETPPRRQGNMSPCGTKPTAARLRGCPLSVGRAEILCSRRAFPVMTQSGLKLLVGA